MVEVVASQGHTRAGDQAQHQIALQIRLHRDHTGTRRLNHLAWHRPLGHLQQDDALLHLDEEPNDGAADAVATAQFQIGVKLLDVRGTVNLCLNHSAGIGHLVGFAGGLGIETIVGQELTREAGGVCHRSLGGLCEAGPIRSLSQ
jgi:hypothetical protein